MAVCHLQQNSSMSARWSGPLFLILLVISVASTAEAQHSRRRRVQADDSSKQTRERSKLDVGKINDANDRDAIGPHAEGEAVVRAEILLDRLKFSPGEISDSYGDNLAKAIAAFQADSGLPAMGSMDGPTWAALNDDQATGHVQPKQSQAPAQTAQPPAQQPQPQGQAQAGGKPDQSNGQNQNQHPNQDQNQSQGANGKPNQNQNSGQASQAKPAPAGNPQRGSQSNPQPQGAQPPQGGAPPPAIISYTITRKDVAGPFTRLPKVSGRNHGERTMLEEARLPRLNYASAMELLAERFHSSPHLLAQLNPGKKFDQPGEEIQVPNVLTEGPPPAASVVVDAATHSVTARDGGGRALAFYPATVGSQHDPLPVGNWKIVEVRRNPHFKYNPNLFWDSKNKRPRATLAPGLRNPVGVVWIGLSKEHYGIHGTPEPSRIGETYSHGCIRLTNWDASELANIVHVNAPVLLEEGTPLHPEPQPSPSH